MNEKNTKAIQTESRETEIDLIDLGRYILRHWLVVLLLTVAGAVLAFIITAFAITPVYEATSSIYVVSATTNSALDLSDLNLGTSLTADYQKLVKSRTLMENVIEASGEDLSPTQLSGMLTVGNDTGTRILEFTITSPDPYQAMRLANTFAEQAILFLPEVMGVKDNVPTEVDSAILPIQPSNIRYSRNAVIGALVGFVLGVAIFTVMYMMNDTFNSAEDVEKYLGIVPMAMVPENGQRHRRGGGYYYYSNSANNNSGKRVKAS